MPQYWLFKTEPGDYSFDQLVLDRKTTWDGVTNNLALKNLRSIKKGDRVMIYHTGREKAIVGVADVVSGPYPDPKSNDPKHYVIDIRPVQKFPRPVTLSEIKSQKQFVDFDLIRIPRLSVIPVKTMIWRAILLLGGL